MSHHEANYFDATPEQRQLYTKAYNELQKELPNVPIPTSVIETRMKRIAEQVTPLGEPPYSLDRNGKGNGNSFEMSNEGGFPVARIYDEDRAAFILRAVNSHDALVTAIREEVNAIVVWQNAIHPRSDVQELLSIRLTKLRAALTEAV